MRHDAPLTEREDTARPAPGGPHAVTVEFRLKPGCAEAFMDLLTPVLDAMRHETTFINAVLHRDPEDANRFMLYETWADLQDVIEVQIGRPYRQAFWDRLPDLLAEPRRIGTWQPIRSDFAFFSAW